MDLFAKIKSGHDKNHIYYIVEKDDKYVYLANGTTKSMKHPKKKNPLHIQIIKQLPGEVTSILRSEEKLTDQKLADALEKYKSNLNH